jgi:protocatechuate 3,4-dioxygenase beta subunit
MMKRLAAVCVLSVLVAACGDEAPLPRPASASPGTSVPDVSVRFTLSGTVTNSLGVPIEGARVELRTTAYSDEMRNAETIYVNSAYTDSTGRFVIGGLESGSFLIEVSKNGVLLVSGSVTVNDDTTWNVILTP